METFRETPESLLYYQKVFSQNGKGLDIDRYIYRQNGTGLGSFFGKLARFVLPIAKSAFNVAKPHLQAAAADLTKQGTRALTRKVEEGGQRLLGTIKKPRADAFTPLQ